MEHLSLKIPDDLDRRIEQYRASKDEIPSRSDVTRDALDEFLPELDEGDQDEGEDAPAIEAQTGSEGVEA